jgi:hypothetical protein
MEVCVAIFIVVAHNVYHWVPNEVPILFVLAVASLRLREGIWMTSLFCRPKSWPLTLLGAVVGRISLFAQAMDQHLDAWSE